MSFKIRYNFFKNSFFSSANTEWKIRSRLQNSKSFGVFKNSILRFITTSPSKGLNCDNHKEIRFTKQLHVGLNHCHEHKFKHNFHNYLNSTCSCSSDIESNLHFLLHCPIFKDEIYTLLPSWTPWEKLIAKYWN